MLNYMWAFMIVIGVVMAAFTGRIPDVSNETMNSAKEAVSLCITMLGVMSLWTGIMGVARGCGLMQKLTRLMSPIIRYLFPDIPKDHIVNEHIASNMIANFLGLGWAATPVGLKAMKELKVLNGDSDKASVDMCTFLIINMSSLQLIPVNIVAYRSQYGSVSPAGIVAAAIIATTCSTVAGVIYARVAMRIDRRKRSGGAL